MDIETLRERFTAIGTCENDAERLTLITELRTEVEQDYTDHETTAQRVTTLEADNNKLRENNMALFLRVSESPNPPEENPEDKGGNGGEDKLSFEDLFDEKGALK